MMNVVCFGLSLPVEIVLPPTCNVLLTAFFLLILLQNVRPFFLLLVPSYSDLSPNAAETCQGLNQS